MRLFMPSFHRFSDCFPLQSCIIRPFFQTEDFSVKAVVLCPFTQTCAPCIYTTFNITTTKSSFFLQKAFSSGSMHSALLNATAIHGMPSQQAGKKPKAVRNSAPLLVFLQTNRIVLNDKPRAALPTPGHFLHGHASKAQLTPSFSLPLFFTCAEAIRAYRFYRPSTRMTLTS